MTDAEQVVASISERAEKQLQDVTEVLEVARSRFEVASMAFESARKERRAAQDFYAGASVRLKSANRRLCLSIGLLLLAIALVVLRFI